VQSYYAAASTFYDFIVLFTFILFWDVFFSLWDVFVSYLSLLVHRTSSPAEERRAPGRWTKNNLIFFLLCTFLLLYIGPHKKPDLQSLPYLLLIITVLANCGISFSITLRNYLYGSGEPAGKVNAPSPP
jgi:hypothetical protein